MGPIWSTCASGKGQQQEDQSAKLNQPEEEKAADAPAESPKTEKKVSVNEVVPELPADTESKTPTITVESPPLHLKARSVDYPGAPDDVKRSVVTDEHVRWDVEWNEYEPVRYTCKNIVENKPVWADPDVEDKEKFSTLKFNIMDEGVNRKSYHGVYNLETLDGAEVPRNPCGRTGMKGRGLLGKWGPNHAADPIVTRFKRDEEGKPLEKEGKKVLEFVAIQRRDNKEWAIPGGMVDGGENVSATLKREFGEEALNSIEDDVKEETKQLIAEFFKNGVKIYEGYVDDPRNTDNSWMETTAYNFHDATGTTAGRIPLNAGDDAQAVQWMAIDGSIELYASHKYFIEEVCKRHDAHL